MMNPQHEGTLRTVVGIRHMGTDQGRFLAPFPAPPSDTPLVGYKNRSSKQPIRRVELIIIMIINSRESDRREGVVYFSGSLINPFMPEGFPFQVSSGSMIILTMFISS